MRRLLVPTAAVVLLLMTRPAAFQQPATQSQPAPVLVLTTVRGAIEIELFAADAPKSVARIIELAKRGFYRGQRFHWVQPGVVQVGDVQSRMMSKRADWGRGGSGPLNRLQPIGVAEINKRPFVRGIVGFAYQNGQKPTDADSQIFILRAANPALNGKYAAIGRVGKSMAIVDKIELEDEIKDATVK